MKDRVFFDTNLIVYLYSVDEVEKSNVVKSLMLNSDPVISTIETTVTRKHLSEGISIDYVGDGHIAGIEILDAKVRFGSKDIFSKVELESIGLSVA